MTVKLEEIMAQMTKERQEKIMKRVDELIAEEKALNENINGNFNLTAQAKLNTEKKESLT